MLRLFIAFLVALGVAAPAFAEGARNVNFAAFQKVAPDFEFEPIVLGKFSDFIVAMEGAQILVLAHTNDAVDGDVITVQTDVLRDESGALGDFGLNCQLSFKDESTADSPSYMLGGLCKIIRMGRGQKLNLSSVIPHTDVPDTAQGIDAWVKLHEDKQTGIAFYANVSGSR